MNDFIKKSLMKLITGILILTVLLYLSGFCFEKFRYLSDKEKIKIALNHLLEDGGYLENNNHELGKIWLTPRGENDLTKDVKEMSLPAHPVLYKDVDEFLKLNPNCCHLTQIHKSIFYEGSAYKVNLCDVFFGGKSSILIVSYVFRYTDELGKLQSKIADDFVGIDHCGNLIEETYCQ